MSNRKRKTSRCLWIIILAGAILLQGQVPAYGLEPQQKEITSQKFKKELLQPANRKRGYELKGTVVKGEIKIDDNTFIGDIRIDDAKFAEDLSFNKCTFKGAVMITSSEFPKSVRFANCLFEDDFYFKDNQVGYESQNSKKGNFINFSHSTFQKELNFVGSQFFTYVNFQSCRFLDKVNFGSYRPDESQAFYEGKQDDESGKIRSAFRQGVDFSESFFKGKTLFSYAEFGGAKFCGAIFEGPVRFSKAKFNGRVDFSRAIFHSIVDFERAIFYPVPWLKQEAQGGNTPDMADFYNVSFKDDAYFSKSIFLIDANFKRTSFSQRLFLINTFFSRKAIFDGAILSNEMLGCQINDLGRIKREIAFYKVNKLKDDLNIQVKEEICAYLEKNFAECQTYSPTSSCPIPKDKDPKEIIEMWRGKEFYIGETSFAIIDQENFSCKNQFFSFIGTRFEGGVDFRNGQFNEVDFSSGEIMTIFRGAADLSDAFFGKIFMDGTVFLGKVYLPLENIFSESGMISRSVTIDDFFLKRGLRSENDHMQHRDEKKLRDLYTQLESIFRKNSQIFEANEMALRAAWLKLKLWDAQEKLSSLFILIALPIQNLLVFMLAVNLYFWFRLWAKNSIKARTSESSFRPCKLPLVYMSSEDLQNKGIERIKTPEGEKGIVRPRIWQAYSWPLFLCFGTFFAVLSLGSEYVTDDEGCLRKMKILRIGGFILLPLLLYSLAKRSEGLHPIATFM